MSSKSPPSKAIAFSARNERSTAAGSDIGRSTRYEDELVVATPEPVVAYLASCVDRDLTDEELSVLHNEVAGRGTVTVHKHSVLVIARNGS